MKSKFSPIIIFTYNRKDHTKKTLESLVVNKEFNESSVYIFSDGFKGEKDKEKVIEVRNFLKKFKRKYKNVDITIVERVENLGLEKSVILGVSSVINKFGKAIVLEDDLKVSPYFLQYMNLLLDFFENSKDVGSITGYNPVKNLNINNNTQVFFSQRTCSYGWGTWERVWEEVDWNAEKYSEFKTNIKQRRKFNKTGLDRAIRLDNQMHNGAQSWSVKFGFDLFVRQKLTVYPVKSYLKNLGWDGSGTHNSKFDILLNNSIDAKENLDIKKLPLKIKETESLINAFKNAYDNSMRSKIKEFYNIILNYAR